MPMMSEVRRMGRSWPALVANVASYSKNIPKEGVALSVFISDCLGHIHFDDRESILRALRRKRAIFPVSTGLERRVFGKPVGKRLAAPLADPLLDQFVRGVAPLMLRVGDYVGRELDSGDRDRMREAGKMIAGFVRRHVNRGGTLVDARGAMWRAFHPEVMALLSRYESALAKDSHVQAPAPLPVKVRNLPHGLPPHERILAVVDKAGVRGITKGEIKELFPKPRPGAAQLGAWIAEIEEAQIIYKETMKLTKLGRPGLRYFHCNHKSPRTVNGVAGNCSRPWRCTGIRASGQRRIFLVDAGLGT